MKKLFLYVFLGLLFCNVSNALPKCKGDDVKKWTNCFGTKIYTGDDKYLGDGAKYEGEWKDGQYHGQGNIIWSDGAVHVGNFEEGYRHGKGKSTYPDGMVEEGIFRLGKLDGKGKITYPDGRVVQGTFTLGKLTEPMETKTLPECKGKDTMKWTNCNGQATFDNLATIYAGEWLNGYAHGKGILIGPGLAKYVGQFKDGLRDGLGKQKYENDDLYEGWFRKGLRHGEGILRNISKRKYVVGIWEKDILVGCQDHIKGSKLEAQCQPELKIKKIKPTFKKFPINPFKKQREYVCFVENSSPEESTKLKIYSIYKVREKGILVDRYVVISEKNPDLDNVEMVYFGKISDDDKQLTFFSINSEEKILTVFNLQEIKDSKRRFIRHMFQLDDEELKNVINSNTAFDKELDDPNPSVFVKQQKVEIGIVKNTIDIFQSIKNMSEEKLDKKNLGVKEYFCDVT